MAKLTKPKSTSFDINETAPAGTFVATTLDVRDIFDAERPSFDDPLKKELRDVTRFLFGFRGQDGKLHRVQSFEFRISGSPKSNLMKFLTDWLGRPPEYGWNYEELKGQGALITVAHKQSQDGTRTFANIVGIEPVPQERAAEILPLDAFRNSQ